MNNQNCPDCGSELVLSYDGHPFCPNSSCTDEVSVTILSGLTPEDQEALQVCQQYGL